MFQQILATCACLMRGHHLWTLRIEPDRLYLTCAGCQHETRGYDLSNTLPLPGRPIGSVLVGNFGTR